MVSNGIFNICDTLPKYFDELSKANDNMRLIPLYLDKTRTDIKEKAIETSNMNVEITPLVKCSYGMVVSNEYSEIKKSNLFCEKWIVSTSEMDIIDDSTFLLICLYKDFTESKVLSIIDFCKERKIELFFLLGRDESSLSWIIAKQFLNNKTLSKKGIFSHRNVDELKFYDDEWEIYDSRFLKKKDPKEVLEKNQWSELIFHSHGNEDLIHLDDYTLCGNNNHISYRESFAPACGAADGKCFKECNKLININGIKADKLYFLSCHNIPFYDCKLYSMKYNIVLNAIDGYAKKIISAIAVHSSDIPEIGEIFKESTNRNVSVRLHTKLDDVQPFPCFINIGMPDKKDIVTIDTDNIKPTATSLLLLSRVMMMVSSGMLSQDHPIYKLSKKIINDYNSVTRRGVLNERGKNEDYFERDIINRLNPLSKEMIKIMRGNLSDELHSFDTYNIMRSVIQDDSISYSICECGKKLYSCNYRPLLSQHFPLHAEYCHRCGEKLISMLGMPQIEFECDKYNETNGKLIINYRGNITFNTFGDVFYTILLPNSISKNCITERPIIKIKARPGKTNSISGKIEFNEKIVVQGYWMKLLVVQNAGICIVRSFFNLW